MSSPTTEPTIVLYVGESRLLLTRRAAYQMVMSQLPSLLTEPFDSLTGFGQSVRLMLKQASRALLGVMAYSLTRQNTHGLPLPDEREAERHGLDVVAYGIGYVIDVGVRVGSEQELEAEYVDTPTGRAIVAVHPRQARLAAPSSEAGGGATGTEGAEPAQRLPAEPVDPDDSGWDTYRVRAPLGHLRGDGDGQDGVQQATDDRLWDGL